MSRCYLVLLVAFCAAAAPVRAAAPASACGSPARACDAKFMGAVAKIAAVDVPLADDYRALYTELIAYSPDSIKLEKDLPDVPAAALAEYNRRRHALIDRGVAGGRLGVFDKDGELTFGSPLYLADYYVGFAIYALAGKDVPEHFAKIAAELGALEDRTAALEADVKASGGAPSAEAKAPLEARLIELNADGTDVWNLFHADALNESDSMYGLGQQKQPLMNPLQARVAALSKRLQAVDRALNGDASRRAAQDAGLMTAALRARMNPDLGNLHPFGPDASAGADPGAPARAGAPANARGPGAGAAPAPARAKTLLDLSAVPAPESAGAPGGPRPPVFAGSAGEDAAPLATKAVDALRAAGKTETRGDVSRRAGFVFHQTGNTCAIGAQVEVLADLGEVKADPQALKAKEDELYARAVSLGYFEGSASDPQSREHGGNSWMHVGDLLDRPIQRLFAVSPADLQKTVATGRMAIVDTDSGVLWHQRDYAGMKHTVVVTGEEVERATGKLLGYYVNDTGTGEGGRFVAAAQFLKAWDGTLVVPQ